MMEWMGGWMILWGLLGLALLVLTALGIAWLVRSLAGPSHPATEDPAEQELRRRYASGELTSEEYHQRLADLRRRGR